MTRFAFMHSHTFILTGVRPFGECYRGAGAAGAAEHNAANDDCRCAIALFTEGPGSVDLDGSGNIHLAEAKWNYDDSLTRHRLLPVLPHILASRL